MMWIWLVVGLILIMIYNVIRDIGRFFRWTKVYKEHHLESIRVLESIDQLQETLDKNKL